MRLIGNPEQMICWAWKTIGGFEGALPDSTTGEVHLGSNFPAPVTPPPPYSLRKMKLLEETQ